MKKGSRHVSRSGADDPIVIWGLHPVEECLKVRPSSCLEIRHLPSFGRKKAQAVLLDKIRESGVPFSQVSRFEALDLPEGAVHQGIAALVRPFWFEDVTRLARKAGAASKPIVVCDQISDPRNLGAVIRAAAALGAAGIVFSRRHSASINGTVIKASAGAVFHLQLALVSNIPQALKVIKESGFWIYGLDSRADLELSQVDLSSGPTALVAGSEEKGLRKNVRKELDFQVKIPINPGIESLNVSCAVAVALYECRRQKAGLK